jgi:RimJ/RimL family protein N-acetyltransferase
MNFEKQVTRIVSRSFEAEVFVVPWDSEILGFPVGQIESIKVRGDERISWRAAALRKWLDQHGIQLASCRLGSKALKESMFLETNGFRFIEMVYSPTLSPLPDLEIADPNLEIATATVGDLGRIEAIAGSAFVTSRFFLDWRIRPDAGHNRYRQWVRNSFGDSQQVVLKATQHGLIVGFFIVEERPNGTVYWHLTAIDPASQGRGLGKCLWTEMIRWCRARGGLRIDTTISAHNVAVMNIYAALGFRFDVPRMTLHWVRG